MSNSPLVRVSVGVGLLVMAGAVFVIARWNQSEKQPPAEDPMAVLERYKYPKWRRDELAGSIKAYKPTITGGITDLSTDAAAILRRLPGVEKVIANSTKGKPTKRIIQFDSWHYVPRDQYAADYKQGTGHDLSDNAWELFLIEVEMVEGEHAAALETLVAHHGLKHVLIERLTEKDLPGLPEKMDLLRGTGKQQGKLASQADSIRQHLRAETAGTDQHRKLLKMQAEVNEKIDAYRQAILEHGAAIWLLIVGQLDTVLPLDDAALLDVANPFQGGKIVFDKAAIAKREDAMVKKALDSGSVSLIILGGLHDLSGSIQRIAGDGVEYIRVKGKAYREVSGEK